MPKTRRQIAREVDEILAAAGDPRARAQAQEAAARGQAAYQNILSEARAAAHEPGWADNADAIPVQRRPGSAHALVSQSEDHAQNAERFLEFGQGWVREAQGTPQLADVQRVLQDIQTTVKQTKAFSAATKRAFEKRYGKYDPRGLTDQNMQRA